jgi:Lectin C-type domain
MKIGSFSLAIAIASSPLLTSARIATCKSKKHRLGARRCTRKPRATAKPTPLKVPTNKPSRFPTIKPTSAPTGAPTIKPTGAPTSKPTVSPTRHPTKVPTHAPSQVPTSNPTTTCPGAGAALQHGGHLYSAVSSAAPGFTWNEANAAAQGLSCCGAAGHLATIADAAENDFIRLNLGGVQGWIGFNDVAIEGSFVWVTGEPVTYTNWNSGEPNNSNGIEDCVEIYGSHGGWNDLPCDGQANAKRTIFIIEYDCAP